MEPSGKIIFIMGVSGSGKSTIGLALAKELSVPLIDADDHHPKSNIDKMRRGEPLNDEDRLPWLDKMNGIASEQTKGCVIACSALKKSYRDRLMMKIETRVVWIYLKGSFDLILDRMKKRKDHFMGANMLRSQFESLEEPSDVMTMDISDSQERIVHKILLELK